MKFFGRVFLQSYIGPIFKMINRKLIMRHVVTLIFRMAHNEAMLDKRAQHDAEMARIKGEFELKKMEIEASMIADRILKD